MTDIMDTDGPEMPARDANEADDRVEAALVRLTGAEHHVDCPRGHARSVLYDLATGNPPRPPLVERHLKFAFRERKALEAVLHVVSRFEGEERVPDRSVHRAMYAAERDHLLKWGRPIYCDTYVAGPSGPVGTMLAAMLRGDLAAFSNPHAMEAAFLFRPTERWGAPRPCRKVNPDLLSRSDVEAMDASVERCLAKPFATSELTQGDRAWLKTLPGAVIDWADMLDPSDEKHGSALEHLHMIAVYGSI